MENFINSRASEDMSDIRDIRNILSIAFLRVLDINLLWNGIYCICRKRRYGCI